MTSLTRVKGEVKANTIFDLTFDACQKCSKSNFSSRATSALAWPGSTLIVRVRTERTNACATVSTKTSYSELPYKLPTQPPTNKPTAKP